MKNDKSGRESLSLLRIHLCLPAFPDLSGTGWHRPVQVSSPNLALVALGIFLSPVVHTQNDEDRIPPFP